MKQGRVYFPQGILPPGQLTSHRIIVLSGNLVIARLRPGSFLACAIIRSALNQAGRSVAMVPGHSIPVDADDFTSMQINGQVIQHDSIIETHQLFHISIADFSTPRVRALGDLNSAKLSDVLAGARKLFT